MSQTGKKHYCVFGCSIMGSYMHSFPHPVRRPEMLKTWVSIVGNKLKGLDPWKIYKNKKICTFHFRPDQKVACHRLIHNAVPCINLNGKVALAAGPLLVLTEHNYSLLGINGSTISSSEPNTLEVTLNKDATVTDGSLGVEADETAIELEDQDDISMYHDGDLINKTTVTDAIVTDGGLGVEADEAAIELEDQDDISMYHDDDLIYKTTVSDTDQCYACNECKETITGFRYTCLQCADWDLCGACEARAAHAAHYILRIPRGKPYNEVEAALAAIRLQLLSEGLLPEINDRVSDVKSEIKETPEIEELDPLGDHYEGDNNEGDNNEGDNNAGVNNAGDNNEGDNNKGDNNEGDCTIIETDIIPPVIPETELPLRKRPRLGSSHCSEPDLLISDHIPNSPRDRTTVAHDNSSPHHHNSTKSVEDIHGRKLHDKPSIPIVKLIRRSETSHHAGRIPLLKPIAEAFVPLQMRIIKPSAANPTSGLRQEKPIVSPSEDNLTPQRTDQSTATTAEVIATAKIIPKLDRIANAKVTSRLILRVPIGTNRAVVRALKSKVSVRLKRIDLSKWKCKS